MGAPSGPYLIVHNIGHARDAVATAREFGRPVTLISAPGAAASIGPEVFKQMIDAVLGDDPPDGITAVLDCGSDPGPALQAIRYGCENIRLDADAEVLNKLSDMTSGTVLDGAPLDAYDMANGNANLAVWLQGQDKQ